MNLRCFHSGYRPALIAACCCLAFVPPSVSGAQSRDAAASIHVRELAVQSRMLLDSALYDSALVLARHADSLAGAIGPVDADTRIEIENALGWSLYRLADFEAAEQHWRAAYQLKNEISRSPDSLLADLTANLGRLYYSWGQLDTSATAYLNAIEIQQSLFPPDHLDLAASYNNLGNLRQAQGRYAEAVELLDRALSIWLAKFGPDHADVGLCLNNLAIVYDDWGRYAEADSCYRRALDIRTRVFGPVDQSVGVILFNLAALNAYLGDYTTADTLCLRAQEVMTAVFDSKHPNVAACLVLYAIIKMDQGRFDEVEQLYREALAIYVEYYGEECYPAATTLGHLADYYEEMGRFYEANATMVRSETLLRTILGNLHPEVASTLINRAQILAGMKERVASLSLLREAIAIYDSLGIADIPSALQARSDLAIGLCNMGRLNEAEPILRELLPIVTDLYGENHMKTAVVWQGLAAVHLQRGEWREAANDFQQALARAEAAGGPLHPRVGDIRLGLAEAYVPLNRIDTALTYFGGYLNVRRTLLHRVFSFSSEQQKMQWLAFNPIMDGRVLSLATRTDDAGATALAYDMVLKGKARVLDALMTERQALLCSENPELEATQRLHADVCGLIASEAMAGGEGDGPSGDSLTQLYTAADSLESVLARQCSEYRDERQELSISRTDIVALLSSDTILWEYIRYTDFDLHRLGTDAARENAPRYAAFVLTGADSLRLIDLGDAPVIDSLVVCLRTQIHDAAETAYGPAATLSENEVKRTARTLGRLIVDPLLEGNTPGVDIIVAPDGLLNLIPFEILVDSGGDYLAESMHLQYVTTGRDLVTDAAPSVVPGPPLVIADPRFDKTTSPAMASAEFPDLPVRGSTDCRSRQFTPLRYGRTEGTMIAASLAEGFRTPVEQYFGMDATESILKRLTRAPRVLHLATHGFFCDNETEPSLLRSGLALAGANQPGATTRRKHADGDDGLLTALEVSHLNLVGTELATLSACETGVGEVRDGEGVLGLRRAFQRAGSQAVLMSLWRIPDRETSILMQEFYSRWTSGEPMSQALRGARRVLLQRCREERGTSHPLFWGGFILVGGVQ